MIRSSYYCFDKNKMPYEFSKQSQNSEKNIQKSVKLSKKLNYNFSKKISEAQIFLPDNEIWMN